MQNSTFFNVALFGMNDGRRSLPIYDVRFTMYDLQSSAGGARELQSECNAEFESRARAWPERRWRLTTPMYKTPDGPV